MSLSKNSEAPKENKPFLVMVTSLKTKFSQSKWDTRGNNKIYESRRSRSYFFEIDKQQQMYDLKIHTNDKVNTSSNIYQSTSKFPNKKFCVSLMLTQFFKLQKVVPRRIQNKYFKKLRNMLYDRYNIIKKRQESLTKNNRITKTYINFTYKKYRFKMGIYQPCGFIGEDGQPCTLPIPFVISTPEKNIRITGCCSHQKHIVNY